MKKSINILKEVSANIKALNSKQSLQFINLVQGKEILQLSTVVTDKLSSNSFRVDYIINSKSDNTFSYSLNSQADKLEKACKNIDGKFNAEGILSNGKRQVQFSINKDFQDLPTYATAEDHDSIAIKDFVSVYDKVKDFVSKDSVRPILTGVNFNSGYAYAVDGYRVAKIKAYDVVGSNTYNNFTIPQDVMSCVAKWSKSLKAEVTLKVDKDKYNFIITSSDLKVIVSGEHIQGEYLNCEKVLQGYKDYNFALSVNAKDFMNELKFLVDIEGLDKIKNPMVISPDYDNNTFNLSIAGTQSKIDITPIKVNKDKLFKFAFNPKYLIDALKNSVENPVLYYDTAISPLIIESGIDTFLVLPVRINQ